MFFCVKHQLCGKLVHNCFSNLADREAIETAKAMTQSGEIITSFITFTRRC